MEKLQEGKVFSRGGGGGGGVLTEVRRNHVMPNKVTLRAR